MMLRLLRSDLCLLLRDRLPLLVLAIGLAVTALAVANGARWTSYLETNRDDFLSPNEAAQPEHSTKFAGSAWTDVDSTDAPYTNRRSFAFPVTVLANLTIGRSDIEPSMTEVRMSYRADTLFRNYQIDNPERYQHGRIDLSFVAIGVALLLLIALGYGMLTGDRDSGTLRLIAVQTGGVGRLVAARSINRLPLVMRPLAL